jgi:hypothetical protein
MTEGIINEEEAILENLRNGGWSCLSPVLGGLAL